MSYRVSMPPLSPTATSTRSGAPAASKSGDAPCHAMPAAQMHCFAGNSRSLPGTPARPLAMLPTAKPALPARNWATDNHARLSAWLHGLSRQTHASQRVTAAFDWDGTSIVGDSGVFCWHYMVDQFLIRVSPDKMDHVLLWPDAALYPGTDAEHIANLRYDILEAYQALWRLQDDREALMTAPQRLDFRAKLGAYCAYYDGVMPHSLTEGPLWMKWFTGFLPHEIGALAVQAVAKNKDTGLCDRTWSSTPTGLSGQVNYTFRAGLQRRKEMFDLMRALDKKGVDVCVVTGGIEPMVRALVKHMGAPVRQQHVIGIRYHRDAAGRLLPDFLPDAHRPISYGPGKTTCIRKFLPGAPILVAGDTGGDLDMLQAFAQTQMRLIVANALRGPLLALAQDATAPTTVLQAVYAAHGGFAPQPVDLALASAQGAAFGLIPTLPALCTETAAASAYAHPDETCDPSSSGSSPSSESAAAHGRASKVVAA